MEHPNGTKVTRVKQDNYTLTTGDDFAHIKGNSSVTTDGGVRVFVNADGATEDGHYTIEIGNNANVNIQVNKGNVNVVIDRDLSGQDREHRASSDELRDNNHSRTWEH